jgi:hypothetical protein
MQINEAFDQLAQSLEASGITKSNMFGMPVLKLGKKPVAGLAADGINFKLPKDSADMAAALDLAGAHLFQPEMHGKKGPLMKQWVIVPIEHQSKYDELITASIAFVDSESKNT